MPRRRAGLLVPVLALPAAIALVAGVFGPVVYVGTWFYAGTVSYWQFGGPEKYGMVSAAALALLGAALRGRGMVVLATFALWGAFAYPYASSWFTQEKHGLLTRIGRGVRRPFEEMTTQVILEYDMLNARWGAWSLLAGALALSLAGAIAMTGQRDAKG